MTPNERLMLRAHQAYALTMGFSAVFLAGNGQFLLAGFALFHFVYALNLMNPGVWSRVFWSLATGVGS